MFLFIPSLWWTGTNELYNIHPTWLYNIVLKFIQGYRLFLVNNKDHTPV
jgi:hypothetical protein